MGGVVEEIRWRKGPWTAEEDRALVHHVDLHGEGRWNSVATLSGLKRNGKSCRLRWVNYLRPDLKRGRITPYEETIILHLHARWGNRWSTIAKSLPGRTDNEIKNYWRTRFKKKSKVTFDESAKLKTRLLKREKFKQQRQLQMQENINEVDVKKIMSWLEESENKSRYMPPTMFGIRQQDNCFDEQQISLRYPTVLFNGCQYGSTYVPEASTGEDFGIWNADGMWNLDDVHGTNFCAATMIFS